MIAAQPRLLDGQCLRFYRFPVVCILMKQEMMAWQWHQLDHMRIICIWLYKDNHAGTLLLKFLQVGCSS